MIARVALIFLINMISLYEQLITMGRPTEAEEMQVTWETRGTIVS